LGYAHLFAVKLRFTVPCEGLCGCAAGGEAAQQIWSNAGKA